MTLFGLGFAICELRKALIYMGMWRAGKTPKAEVAGLIPADASFGIEFQCLGVSVFRQRPSRFPKTLQSRTNFAAEYVP